jgi:hypothetical protein
MPDFRAYVRENLPPLGVSSARHLEIVEEVALEFEERYERALRNGLDPEQAWQEVRDHARPWHELGRELLTALGEQHPELPDPATRPKASRNLFARYLDELRRDLSYGVRQLLKSPGFTITAVLTLALGIGANTAIFSLLNAIMLRSLPVRQPDQLVFFGKTQQSGTTRFFPHGSTQAFSFHCYREFRQRNEVFSNVAAIQSFLVTSHGRVAGSADLERINVELVSGSYFNTLGVNPALGRLVTDEDDLTPGGHPIAVASYSYWQNRFAGDPSITGATIRIGPATLHDCRSLPTRFLWNDGRAIARPVDSTHDAERDLPGPVRAGGQLL